MNAPIPAARDEPFPDDGADADNRSGEESLTPRQEARLMNLIYERGDYLVTRFIALHALFAFALAFFYQTWLVTGVVTFCAMGMFAVSAKLLPRTFITRCLAGVSLQIFVALHIYQLHGLPEMHFFFFTSFTMLIVYQDWKCMWPGAIGIISQHIGFALLHNAGRGAGLFFFNEGYVGLEKLFFHFGIALGHVALCGYWAYLLRRQTLANAAQNAGLRRMGAQLRRSEGKFRVLIEHALDIITVVETSGIIRYKSPSVERVLGYRPDELIGRNMLDLVHSDDRATVAASLVRGQGEAIASAAPLEFRCRHLDGSWRTLEAVGSIRDGNVGGIVINSRDVTQRRRAEREARRRASQQNATSELARQALAGKNLRTLLDAAVREVARALEVEFCYVGEKLAGDENLLMRAEYGYSPVGAEQKLVPMGPHSQGGFTLLSNAPVIVEDLSREQRFQLAPLGRKLGVRSGLSVVIDGREGVFGVLVTQSSQPRRFNDEDTVFLSAVADILSAALERQCAEEALRAAKEEAEKANAAKSEFLSRISHELRTPLNAILGFGQLMEISELTKADSESLHHIMRAGRHLLDLIDEVLAISRIETGSMYLSLEPVSIKQVVHECLSLVSHLAEARRIVCEDRGTTVEGGDPYVKADRQRLNQVLLNYLSNAIKYNRDGGSVTVSCHAVPAATANASAESTGGAQGTRLRLEVTDTGQGIAEEEIGLLFTPFERLQAVYGATEGTGLGLALSKGLVEAMGGVVGVSSVPGKGSTFWLELAAAENPLLSLRDEPEEAERSLAPGSHCGKVLYVEDNTSNLRLIEMLFEMRPGIELISAQQGRIGLELARAHRPDLILLDLHLPDISGWEILAQLQGDACTREIPTVIISADVTPRQIARLLAAGALEYLTKPVDVRKLMRIVDEHLRLDEAGALVE